MDATFRPRLFVASSKEQLDVARAIQANLDVDAEVTVWEHAFSRLSENSLASIIEMTRTTDFGAFVLGADDLTTLRGRRVTTVRDNVLLELGVFIGGLGPRRCFLIVPRGPKAPALPTDLLGLTCATYDPARRDKNLHAALSPACDLVRQNMRDLGAAATLVRAYGSFQSSEIDWDDLFGKSTGVDLLFLGSSTWRRHNFARLEAVAQRKSAVLRVLLPHTSSAATLRAMATMLGIRPREARAYVADALKTFSDLKTRTKKATIAVFGMDQLPRYSSFRFDDRALLAPYSHRHKLVAVPTLLSSRGDPTFTFVQEEFEALVSHARAKGYAML